MRLVIQRVKEARVEIDGNTVGEIGKGLLVLVGLKEGDSEDLFPRMRDKLINLRLFADQAGNTNLSLTDVKGGILCVSQFTLYADVRKGRRPSFTGAMKPDAARELYGKFVESVRHHYHSGPVADGEFGAMMQVHLVNDGPVTVIVDSEELGLH